MHMSDEVPRMPYTALLSDNYALRHGMTPDECIAHVDTGNNTFRHCLKPAVRKYRNAKYFLYGAWCKEHKDA